MATRRTGRGQRRGARGLPSSGG